MARASKEESARTAARILVSAQEMFAEEGYGAVGLEQVAARAQVTRGAVYHHFTSKSGLFAAVHADAQRYVAEQIATALEGIEQPWESLRCGSQAFLRAALSDRVRRIMLLDAPAVLGWQAWREADSANSARMLGQVLQELSDAGELRVDPAAARAVLSGAMNELVVWAASQEDPEGALNSGWSALDLVLGGLRH